MEILDDIPEPSSTPPLCPTETLLKNNGSCIIGGKDTTSQVFDNDSLMQGTWIPEVEDMRKPVIGMVFKTLEDAELFYKEYGRAGGFDTRNSSTKYLANGMLNGKSFVCSKEGETKSKSNGSRNTGSIRTNCKAIMRLTLDQTSGMWIIKNFIEEHNHEVVTPSRLHLLKANREVSKAQKRLVKQFKESNVSTSKAMTFLENENGGYNRIGFTERDLRNWERDIKQSLKGHDAQMLIDHFNWHQGKNPSFFYAYDTTDEGKLKQCFWVDAVGRLNFSHFGDVLMFDATHNTNQYGLILAAFVGLNHHSQSIFMGAAFIPNESSNSFEWVFRMFLKAMGKPPTAMITDQDLGIGKALSIVFPNTRHRLCMWHILDKVPDKLGPWAHNKQFMKLFKDNIWNAVNPEEFEIAWNDLLKKNKLNNDWLNSLWMIRERWVPAYHRTHFWAGASSTQRSEGMNALMKMHVSRLNTLCEFAVHFDRILARQRENEIQADHGTLEKKPILKTLWEMEKQMSQVYTTYVFYKFQEEIQESLMQNVCMIAEELGERSYQVSKCGDQDHKRLVKYFDANNYASCACLMFEFTGIPCRHILAVLKQNDHKILPNVYIMQRWTKYVKRGIAIDKEGNLMEDGIIMNFSSHLSELSYWAKKIVDIGLTSTEAVSLVGKRLREMYDEVKSMLCEDGELNDVNSEDENGKRRKLPPATVYDPDQAKTKGRNKGKRMKPGRENIKGRNRICNGCKRRGQNHDIRNCPFLKQEKSKACNSSNPLHDENEDDFEEYNSEDYNYIGLVQP